MRRSGKSQLYYGWKVVAAILVVLTFSSGLSFYNHTVILNALSQQAVFSVQSASVAVSVFFLSGGFTGLGVGRMLSRYDPRLCITGGALISCGALIALGRVATVWQLYVVYAVFGMGFAAAGVIPATTLVARWFRRRRAMALSVASTGLSLGGVVITPICAGLVQSLGLSRATPYMGLMYLLGTIPIAWLLIRPSPEAVGLPVDGMPENPSPPAGSAAPLSLRPGDGIAFNAAWRRRFFWGVGVAYVFLMMAQVGGIAHQYGLARESLTDRQTVFAVAILPVASIAGRLFGGWVVEQTSIRAFAITMMVLQVVALSILSLGQGALFLCVGLALFGVTVGNLLMLQPLLIAEAFGLRDYAKIFSIANLMASWGTAFGPTLMGLAYAARQNTYALAYGVGALMGLLGLMVFVAGGPVNQRPESR